MRQKWTRIFTMIKYRKKVINVFIYRECCLIQFIVFLEECEYVVKEKKMPEYIARNIEISFDDSDEENSDEEIPNKEN